MNTTENTTDQNFIDSIQANTTLHVNNHQTTILLQRNTSAIERKLRNQDFTLTLTNSTNLLSHITPNHLVGEYDVYKPLTNTHLPAATFYEATKLALRP